MRHKPDKNWENLLKNKFENAEIKPSEKIWDNIEKELIQKKRKLFPILWRAAALILLISSALLTYKNTLNSDVKPLEINVINKKLEIIKITDTLIAKNKMSNKQEDAVLVVFKKTKLKQKNNYKIELIANIETNKTQYDKPDLINKTSIQSKTETNIMNKDSIVLAANLPHKEAIETILIDSASIAKNRVLQAIPPKKEIRNVGDVVNFLVGKIDKRDKKIIKFKTDKGGNSSIAAINIGFIQLNSKQSYNN